MIHQRAIIQEISHTRITWIPLLKNRQCNRARKRNILRKYIHQIISSNRILLCKTIIQLHKQLEHQDRSILSLQEQGVFMFLRNLKYPQVDNHRAIKGADNMRNLVHSEFNLNNKSIRLWYLTPGANSNQLRIYRF